MQSDLELRAWLAEHLAKLRGPILGWTELAGGYELPIADATDLIDGKGEIVPAYEASWEGMGLVVEAMRERGWQVLIDCNGMWQGVPDGDARVSIFDRVDHTLVGEARHPDAPLAAAQAARAAIEAEVGHDAA